MLGNEDLNKYMIHITNLMIIWMYTAEQEDPLPYVQYVKFREMMVMELTNEIAKVIDPKIYMPNMEFKPIQSPVYSKPPPTTPKAPTEVPKPFTVYSPCPLKWKNNHFLTLNIPHSFLEVANQSKAATSQLQGIQIILLRPHLKLIKNSQGGDHISLVYQMLWIVRTTLSPT